jgi:predicted nucleic acid-binding protein
VRQLTNEVVFLDANVVMYAVGSEHPYRLPCQQVMTAIANDALKAAIDTEIVQEILTARSDDTQRQLRLPRICSH